MVKLVKKDFKLSSRFQPWVNLNLPRAKPASVGLVSAELPTTDPGEFRRHVSINPTLDDFVVVNFKRPVFFRLDHRKPVIP
jgi:hypothetical protein